MKKIVIITARGLRHKAFKYYISQQKGIKVLETIIEQGDIKLDNITKNKRNILRNNPLHNHIKLRERIEEDFFDLYLNNSKDNSNSRIKTNGYSSSKTFLSRLKKLNPNLIIVYGSSIIKGEILNIFKNRILNVHLGLSPYYKGSATNYFSLVNNEPEYFGATFMFLDRTIDGGKIIHQIRPNIYSKDNIHQIGNRLIVDMFKVYKDLILNFDKIKVKKNKLKVKSKFYKKKDFTLHSLKKLNLNFTKSMIGVYLKNKKKRDSKVPLIQQSWIK